MGAQAYCLACLLVNQPYCWMSTNMFIGLIVFYNESIIFYRLKFTLVSLSQSLSLKHILVILIHFCFLIRNGVPASVFVVDMYYLVYLFFFIFSLFT